MPDLKEFGFNDDYIKKDPRSSLQFIGGENEGMKRLNDYIWV